MTDVPLLLLTLLFCNFSVDPHCYSVGVNLQIPFSPFSPNSTIFHLIGAKISEGRHSTQSMTVDAAGKMTKKTKKNLKDHIKIIGIGTSLIFWFPDPESQGKLLSSSDCGNMGGK